MSERAGDSEVEPGEHEQCHQHDGEQAARGEEQHDADDRCGTAKRDPPGSLAAVMLISGRFMGVQL